ncbi:hypothetical protein B5F83_01105 [Muribaculum sp. An289]|uniref:DUF3164 family protein n=1 Tax=unclassified Muribaculum TaxID=2622126 RepID=UPI000B395209|nr:MULTISPECIES: DUF3164 family protein [unclassified Muribaculum]OUO38491.1 hypothetical protein B5F83_01105 [Muribaculum sp. An289]OUO43982.1 hypothetical protein B5F81_02080 [Muribaculum sp. An287]
MEKGQLQISEAELAEFRAFQAERQRKAAAEKAKSDREAYRQMVDNEIDSAIPELLQVSRDIKTVKRTVLENFKAILEMKSEILHLTKDDQRSHTFTNSEGNKRITLGVYTTDGYRDTAEDGVRIVREYIESLAGDDRTRSLVSMVMKLLSRDNKGTLKASRILQLRKIAEENGDPRFIEGVRIIEEAYQPAVSKTYIKAEIKGDNNEWVCIPLGMTEA